MSSVPTSVPETPEAKRQRPLSPLTVPPTPEPTQEQSTPDCIQQFPVMAKVTYKEEDQVVIRTLKVLYAPQKEQLLELVKELLCELNDGSGIKSVNVQLVRTD